jgi:hypothetical protein
MSFDKAAALYVFCADFHGGQNSRLYRIMSRLGGKWYRLRLSNSAWDGIRDGGDEEWEQAHEIYKTLVVNTLCGFHRHC